MKQVIVQELRFELPDGFDEASIDMWGDGVDQPTSKFAIVATRRALGSGSLEQLLERDLASLGASLAISILERRAAKVGGQSGIDVRFRSKPPAAKAMLYQRIVAVAWNGSAVAWTAASEMRHRLACDAHLDEMLATTKFRRIG